MTAQHRRDERRAISALRAAAAFVAICAGCGEKTELVSVSGTVSVDGVAMSGGSIQFLPQGEGAAAFGDVNPDGTFVLTTREPDDGAKPGSYKVAVVGQRAEVNESRRPSQEPPRLLYNSPQARPYDVVAGQDNKFAIDIRKADGWQISTDD